MYPAPQTFLWDDSPPTSPIEKIPVVQISTVPEQCDKARKKAHRRWNSYEKMLQPIQPFSYEYRLEDGQLAGLAEYHPDEDYLHYSSSRSTSRSVSRNASTRTSKEESLRPSFDQHRTSSSSKVPRPDPPPSPKKVGALKRALSLRNLAGRGSAEEKRTAPPSPRQRPGIEKLVASFGPHGPQSITRPIPSPPERHAEAFYEMPRAAPHPPQRQISKFEKRPEPLREIKANVGMAMPRRPLEKALMSAKEAQYPAKPPTPSSAAPPGTAITSSQKVQPHTPPITPNSTTTSRPALRHKTSRFLEHIDGANNRRAMVATQNTVSPTAAFSLPPFDFQLPVTPKTAEDASPFRLDVAEVRDVSERDADNEITKPREEGQVKSGHTSGEVRVEKMQEKKVHFAGPWQQNMSRKRSGVNMKALPPTPGGPIKRSTSTRSRPPPVMGDVCMAQVKPVLTSPVVAFGHARMISC